MVIAIISILEQGSTQAVAEFLNDGSLQYGFMPIPGDGLHTGRGLTGKCPSPG